MVGQDNQTTCNAFQVHLKLPSMASDETQKLFG